MYYAGRIGMALSAKIPKSNDPLPVITTHPSGIVQPERKEI